MQNYKKIKLIYPEEASLYIEYFKPKGFLPATKVELPNGTQYPVYFYDETTAKSDLELLGQGFVAEPGLILIPQITKEYMEAAVEKLYVQGYFDHLKPIKQSTSPLPSES